MAQTKTSRPSVRITPDDPAWPSLWRQMIDPPAAVHVDGDPAVLRHDFVAIVGTRRASPRGLAIARGLGLRLSTLGYGIVSGLARGVDAAAHRGALEGGGLTVGVMATGLDRTYPAGHLSLRRQIQAAGCCLTEFPEGVAPLKGHFPRRNRLIAGLARAVVVVEAPQRSGAMLTAGLALDYDREVMAVPGPVDMDTWRGCHKLLREGAQLVESAADVLQILGPPQVPFTGAEPAPGLDRPLAGSPAAWILDRLDLEGVRRDDLRDRWPGSEDRWQEGLLALELAGLIRRLPGGRLARSIWNR